MNLETKVELAFQKVLSGITGLNVYVAHGDSPRVDNYALITIESASEIVEFTSNLQIGVLVEVVSEADQAEPEQFNDLIEQHRNNVSAVNDVLLDDDLKTVLNGAGIDELTVMNAWRSEVTPNDNEDRTYRNVSMYQVYAGAF